jgi:hypothetical protein
VNLQVWLQMVECLEYSLHELILSGYKLLYLRVVVGVVGLAVAGLTVAHISFLELKPQLYAVIF